MRKKLPAYGRAVLTARRQGLAPSGWLSIMRTWPKNATGLDTGHTCR